MRRPLLASLLFAILAASPARAGAGLDLSWDHCYGEGSVVNHAFACDTNSGQDVAVGSFVVDAPIDGITGIHATVDIGFCQPWTVGVPSWWSFLSFGSCRRNALAIDTVVDPSWTACEDFWAGQGLALPTGYNINLADTRGNAFARLTLDVVLPAGATNAAEPGVENVAFRVRFSHVNTVGTGACPGCMVPAAVAFEFMTLARSDPATNRLVSGAANGLESNRVTWQSGTASCLVVPTRTSTWGAVKSLYR